MASPDGLGWPEEPAGFSLRAARDESKFMTAGLGWPRRGPGTRQPATTARTVVAGSGQDTARPARGVSRTGVSRTGGVGKGKSSGRGHWGSRRPELSKRYRRRFHVKRMHGTSARKTKHREVAQ